MITVAGAITSEWNKWKERTEEHEQIRENVC
jgi:hypothetical protein